MIDPEQFRLLVIRPALRRLGLWSLSAERLLLATAITESELVYLEQIPAGPALGPYQMEPGSNADIWTHYLGYRPVLAAKVWALAGGWLAREREVIGNLYYATAMARLQYRRVPLPLPAAEDLEAMAGYYKRHYNTSAGKGSVEKFLADVEPHWQTSAFRDDPRPGT